MNLHIETQQIQSNLSSYCRTADYIDLPGVKPEGIRQYRRLVFGVAMDAIANSYPIAIDFIDEDTWKKMVDDFFSNHKCQSYQVWNIAGEFFEYAKANNWADKFQVPLLNDLLQFEWAETEMYNMPDLETPPFSIDGDLLQDVPVFNPEFRIYQFEYPVHKMHPEHALSQKGNFFMLMFRNPDDGKIHFMDISVFWVWMIEQITLHCKSVDQALLIADSVFGKFNIEEYKKSSIKILSALQKKKFLMGFNKQSNSPN